MDTTIDAQTASADERYYRICKTGFMFGLLQHTLLLVVFYLLSLPILSLYNGISILTFVVALYLNEKRHFYAAMTLAYIEITIHQVFVTYMIGWETGFHIFLIFNMMLPLLTQRGHVLWKSIIMGSSFIAYFYLLINLRTNQPISPLPMSIESTFAIFNKLSFIFILLLIAEGFNRTVLRYEDKLSKEINYANSLLLNILPRSVVKKVGRQSGAIAQGYDSVSVLFADIVGFTSFAEKISPDRLVELLDKLFTRFDLLVEEYHCEKIKTIGDAYMVSAGVPVKRKDHAECCVKFAKAMLDEVVQFNEEEKTNLSIRIGIHSGPIVAGVIGEKKFSYDLWGDTVNTASRMESSGLPGEIQISPSTKELLGNNIYLKERGEISIKGKGAVKTYLVA